MKKILYYLRLLTFILYLIMIFLLIDNLYKTSFLSIIFFLLNLIYSFIMILTILSLTLSLIIKLKNWYRQAKADKKITKEELNEAVEITKDGIEKINETIKEHKDE